MKRFLFIASVLLWMLTACQEHKVASIPADDEDSLEADIVDNDSLAPDSLLPDSQEQLIESTEMQHTADELFDDFVFNFAANRRLQMKRIHFPLPEVMAGGNTVGIQRDQWHMEHFFMRQDYYTLIFDNQQQMEAVSDTAVSDAIVERIHLDRQTIKRFVFRREEGKWMLRAIQHQEMGESQNASFLSFYERFATDSTFQSQHLADIISFSAPDPEDDFSTLEGVITPETWEAFAPELPENVIYNIVYGKHPYDNEHKIFIIRGIANDSQVELSFDHIGGRWVLTALKQ
jgi:hypothetical protein